MVKKRRGCYFVQNPGLPTGNSKSSKGDISMTQTGHEEDIDMSKEGLDRISQDGLMLMLLTALKEGNVDIARDVENALKRKGQDCAEGILGAVTA